MFDNLSGFVEDLTFELSETGKACSALFTAYDPLAMALDELEPYMFFNCHSNKY